MILLSESCLETGQMLQSTLEQWGYEVHWVEDEQALMSAFSLSEPEMVLLSMRDQQAQAFQFEVLQTGKQCMPNCQFVVMVDFADSAVASAAIQLGASDYLLRPYHMTQLQGLLERLRQCQQDNDDMVAQSSTSRQLQLLAHRTAQTDATVLICGESGTGKERLARYIHQASPRRDQPFIAVNCAAIPENMLESILFGYAKGAYTGAVKDQPGKFELAQDGTLLLDEIAEMAPPLQAKLLRVLQEQEVERLGSHKTIKLNVRIIAATNKDLREEVSKGTFREDLLYRLDVLPLNVSPLRERRDDILPLARHFVKHYDSLGTCQLSAQAEVTLLHYPWPGNIRELENVIQRALILRHGEVVQPADLLLPGAAVAAHESMPDQLTTQFNATEPQAIRHPDTAASPSTAQAAEGLQQSKRKAEFEYVLDTLRQFAGHRGRTAEALGMTTRALRYKLAQMRELGIDIEQAQSAA